MAVDTAANIGDLDATKPTGGDALAEADDNFRHIKSVLKANLPNVKGAVSASHVELSYVAGLTSAIQTQLDAKAPLASPVLTGIPTVPTASLGTSTLQAASTAFVQAAIASVNAQAALALSIDNSAAIAASAGQHIVCTNAAAVTVTLPPAPTAGQMVWVTPGNGRTDNIIAPNGQLLMGLAEDLLIDNANVTVELRFVPSLGWRLV